MEVEYDFPANERIRTFLRLESLFDRFEHFTSGERAFDHTAALQVLFEVLDATVRGDIKGEVLQELERVRATLRGYRNRPEVEPETLEDTVEQLRTHTERVHRLHGRLGQELRNDEWLALVKQRAAMPGGLNAFDLPLLYYWLQQPVAERRRRLQEFAAPFAPVQAGVSLALSLLRASATPEPCLARRGVYHVMLNGRPVSLVRVRVGADVACAPEVSANRLALNVRFTRFEDGHPRGCTEDIAFGLTRCHL